MTSSAIVTVGAACIEESVRTCVFCLEHSGQRIPTEVGVMHDVQIGRPQLEQETPVSRDGWR
jgi:hypothetical protein